MLFSEVYGSYFNVLAAVLEEAVAHTLSASRVAEIAREKAFAESAPRILAALESGEWPLLCRDFGTPIQNAPATPLTLLQKRWLKALLNDPRIRLFGPPAAGLEDVEPLYAQDVFEYFDRYSDGDPFEDETYVRHFRLVLTALREGRKLRIHFRGGKGREHSWVCVPRRLEYSSKDDKFRLVIDDAEKNWEKNWVKDSMTVNLARVISCEFTGEFSRENLPAMKRKTDTLVMELTDERNALERAMLHFSHLEKETRRLDGNRYSVTLHYGHDDETEMLIRVLSFGPMLQVISPENFIGKIRERLKKQINLES